MNYWLDLFTGTTWDEFQTAGASVSGFRHRMRNAVAKIQPGDILLCYMTGVMRWVGALEVLGKSDDTSDIWSVADFPERLAVRPVVMLDAEHGVPMAQLEGHVDFFEGPQHRGRFKGFIRRSPNLLQEKDGEYVMELLRGAEQTPVKRAVDPKKLARTPLLKAETTKGKHKVEMLVTVPETEEAEEVTIPAAGDAAPSTPHTETQYRLLQQGAEMGFDVWVARNDRRKTYDGVALGGMPRMVADLPTQFNEATNKTIELIDVLWLKGNSIVAAFEIECTTSVYSGLLRMSDLLALQPNLKINLYIVAEDNRRDKVQQEILRPTFMVREKPLAEICGFLSISKLTETIDGAKQLGLAASLKPGFLEQIAEYFTEND